MKENLSFEEQLTKFDNLKKRKFITKIFVIIFIFLTFFVYLVSPLSTIQNFSLKGNYFISKNDILNILNVSKHYSLYLIDNQEFKNKLNDHPLIKSSQVSVSIFGLNIEIEERSPVLKVNENEFYFNDNTIRNKDDFTSLISDQLLEKVNNLPTYLNVNDHQLTLKEINHLQDIYFKLSTSYQQAIKYINVISENQYGFFFEYGDNLLYEIVVKFNNNLCESLNIAYALDKNAQSNYYTEFLEFPDDKLVLKSYQNEEITFQYYSIIVTIEFDFGNNKVRYDAAANN